VIPDGNKFIKREVCEGDIDSVEVNLIGRWQSKLNLNILTFTRCSTLQRKVSCHS